METCLLSHQLFDAILRQILIYEYEVVSVLIAVILPPAGQTPKRQSDHFKQENVGHLQEHKREESQGIETCVVSSFPQIF